MKILHLAFVDTSYGQILQKIDQQFTALKKLNPDSHCRVIGINNHNINLDRFAFNYTDLQKVDQEVSRIKYFKACEKEINHYHPDIVYFRYPYFDSYALDFVKAHDQIVFENQTIAEYEFFFGKAEEEKKYGPLILGHSRGIVGVTEEILNYELKRAFGSPPGYVMTNGIDVNSLPFIDDKPKTNEINLYCAAHFAYWHGIDRLIYGLSQYDMNPPVILHLVGHGPELNTCTELVKKFNLERHIKLYGFLENEKLSQIAQLCDIGVGPLAIHRKGINESCSLKTREFCLRGLPFIYSGKDADFEETLPFVQQIASTDDPIDIKAIVDFANRVQQNPQIRYQERKYAIENLSWTVKIRGLIDFLNTIKDRKSVGLRINQKRIISKEEAKNLSTGKIDKTHELHLDAHYSKEDNSVFEHYSKIQKLIESGQEAQAIAALENFIRNTDNFALAYNDLGVLHYRSGNKDTAEKFYQKAVELNPQSITFKKNLADLYYVEFKKVEEALRLYVDILSQKPQDVETLLTVAHICIALNKFEDAKDFYNRILEIEPWNQEAKASLEKLKNTNCKIDVKPVDAEISKRNNNTRSTLEIAFYALRELHMPVLLPVYHELSKMGIGKIGFMAPPYRVSDNGILQEGLSQETLKDLNKSGIAFWGHEPKGQFDCVVVADACYDYVDDWGPVVCIGHGTISKGMFFTDSPFCRRENFATVLCVPGPWYQQSFGDQVLTRIEPTGFSKMDELASVSSLETSQLMQAMEFSPLKKTILFAPTFNPELTSMTILKDEWKKLDPDTYQVIFKLHGAVDSQIKKDYQKLSASQSNFYYVNEPAIAPSMHVCDILVSDVSSVYVEFFALGKPIILVNNPQMAAYAGYDPQNIEYQVRDAAYQIYKAEGLHEILDQLKHSDPLQPKRSEYAEKLFPPLDGQNSKRIAEQIVKVVTGEIQLTTPANHTLNIYVPYRSNHMAPIEENLARATSPVKIFTHDPHISHIGSSPIHRLEEGQVPPTPLICMTGQHVFPHQWDYIWYLTDHFNRITGAFGSSVRQQLDDRYHQQGPLSDDMIDKIHQKLQAHHKVHKSLSERVQAATSLQADGLIITGGVDTQLIQGILEKVRHPGQDEFSSEDIRAAGYQTGVLPGFYCYSKPIVSVPNDKSILQLTAQLKQQPGNATLAADLKTMLTSSGPMLHLSQCDKKVPAQKPCFRFAAKPIQTLKSSSLMMAVRMKKRFWRSFRLLRNNILK